MQYPELEDPFNLSEDTIKNIIEDPDGRQRIQAYMHSLSDQLFKNALSSIKELNQEWAFPDQEVRTSQESIPETQSIPASPKDPVIIQKKDIRQTQENISSPQINHHSTQVIPKKAEPAYKQENKLSLNPELIISDSIPEEQSPIVTAELSSQPLDPHIPEIQTERIEKEEPEKGLPKAEVNSEELESRYKKRQESLQDILKKKGNIS